MDKNNRSKLDLLAHEVLAWRRQGKSYRSIEKLLKEEYGLKISYRTVQAWLVRNNHPELAEDQAMAPSDEDEEDHASPPAQAQAEKAQAPPSLPAEDLATLRAQLDALARAHQALQARSTAQQAEIITLTEQRPAPEVPPMPNLPVPVYGGSWEHDMPLLPGEPLDITPVSPRRVLRRVLTLGVIVTLLALGALAFYTAFQDTLARAYDDAMHSPHVPFAVLAAAMVIAGLGLGLRVKAFVPALLALAAYLLMLRNAHIPFVIAVVLTLQVSKALMNGR